MISTDSVNAWRSLELYISINANDLDRQAEINITESYNMTIVYHSIKGTLRVYTFIRLENLELERHIYDLV